MLRSARRRAGLSQRALARAAAVPQPVIARLESGASVPRVDTFDRLIAACGLDAELAPRLGEGVDRSVIRELLDLSPGQRLRRAVVEARNLAALRAPR